MKARRVVFVARNKVEVEDFSVGDAGPGELLLRTLCTMPCPGTERAFLLGLENTIKEYPEYPGGYYVGEVLTVGAGVEGFSVGDRVVAAGGQHASHQVVSIERAFVIPAGLEAEHAVFWYIGTISLQGVRKSRIELGESAVILGQGMIGNMALQLIRLDGGMPVIGVDLSERRLAMSLACGADAAVKPEELEETLKSFGLEDGPAVTIEATGVPAVIITALKLVPPIGRVILLGSPRGLNDNVNFYTEVHRKSTVVLGAHCSVRPKQDSSPGHWTLRDDGDTVMRLLASGRLTVDKMISHRVNPEKAPEIYEEITSGSDSLMGAVFQWGASE